eukprot:2186393-Amphidinium_carterae.1
MLGTDGGGHRSSIYIFSINCGHGCALGCDDSARLFGDVTLAMATNCHIFTRVLVTSEENILSKGCQE